MKLKRVKVALAINLVAVGLIASWAVLVSQLFALARATDEARAAAVSQWAAANPDGDEVAERYRQACENGPAENPENRIPVRPVPFSECAQSISGESLAAAIRQAEDSVEVPLLLRWL